MTTVATPFARSLHVEALMTAARWPGASPRVVFALVGQLAAGRRFAEGYAFFDELARARPADPLPLAAAGFVQAGLPGELTGALSKLDSAVAAGPGLPNFFRGMVLAGAGRAADAAADLELVVALADRFPPGLVRAARQVLAGTPTGLPVLTADSWVTDRDGFRFVPPRLVELADGVHVAQGYDFADIAFVRTGSGTLVVDTGSTPAHATDALDAYRAVSTAPVTHVILTHAHWDHIGGLDAMRGPGTEIVAQAGFAAQLAEQNERAGPWRRFLPAGAGHRHDVTPHRTIDRRTTLRVGDLDVELVPAHGGETNDALLVHLPGRGVVFAGDILMPYLGGPFSAEGSAEGLFDAMRSIEAMAPAVVIHGHPPLTENFTIGAFPALRSALESLYATVRADLADGRTLAEILRRNHLPELLRDHPEAVLAYVVVRDNLVKRVHRQRTGYWQPDGDGIEDVVPADWALALDLLAAGDAERHTETIRELLARDHLPLALRLADLALRRHADSAALADLRRQALIRLMERHQALNPFKFVVYSELSGVELPRH